MAEPEKGLVFGDPLSEHDAPGPTTTLLPLLYQYAVHVREVDLEACVGPCTPSSANGRTTSAVAHRHSDPSTPDSGGGARSPKGYLRAHDGWIHSGDLPITISAN